MIAACASGLALTAIGLQIVGVFLVSGAEAASTRNVGELTVLFSPKFLGMAVLASWMTLIVGRQWCAEHSWVDRVGRALGGFWIVAGLLMIGMLSLQETGSGCSGFPAAPSSPGPAQVGGELDEIFSHSANP
jgi:hypothetical protein